ncbi:PepSY-associated TM helix domain-containing protein [[Pseudomonas] boreopolis]|uniref:PepSY-associated TM helix domain-containing protein n=1 Tax=Xanthomonas boreopolis TaxID=86183 RepID=UPI003DA0B772
MDEAPVSRSREGEAAPWRFYRAVWRWHFYAGLLMLPFLAWLALTGAAFLYQKPIDRFFHHDLKVVAPADGPRQPARTQLEAALRRQAGQVFRYVAPERADASAEVGIVAPDGSRQVVYVDPYRARVLGTLPEHGTVAWTIRRLHSLDLLGVPANAMIEVAAGWAILLVLTGFYLWWASARAPRKRPHGPARGFGFAPRGRPRQRLFWRDLHATLGVSVGGVLLFLALTGLPWSWLWGAKVNAWLNGHDYGYPAGLRVQVPMSDQRLADATVPAWSLRQARLPRSEPHAGHEPAAHAAHAMAAGAGDYAPQPGAIGLDAALARFDALDVAPGYAVSLPRGAEGVYTASVYPADLARQRVVHLDQYSGRVLLDMRYADYGALARAAEWGINVHLGQQYGVANQLVLLVACLGIVVLCASAVAMWWKRRPAGRLGVPPAPVDPRTLRVVTALLAIGGVLFPLTGLSMLVVLGLDRLWPGRHR